MTLYYHKPAAYNLLNHTQKDEIYNYRIALKGKTRGKGGGVKENYFFTIQYCTNFKRYDSKKKAEKNGKA